MARKKVLAVIGFCVLGALRVEAAPPACTADARQDTALSRTGHIPGLGDVHASVGWDNRIQLTLTARDFEVKRVMLPNREVEITLSGRGELIPLTIRIGGREGLRVARGAHVVWGPEALSAFRAMTDGRAVSAFREHIGEFERRLLAGTATRPDDPHAYGFLLIGAFVSSLSGDPTAVGRARDLILARTSRGIRRARVVSADCVTTYEKALLENDTRRTVCLQAANQQDSWYQRSAQRLLCEAEFIAGALSAEGQFISCTALLPLVSGL